MTRLFTDGAEYGDLLFWDAIRFPAYASASTVEKRTGVYSYRHVGNGVDYGKYFTAISEIYGRVGFWINTASEITRGIMALYKGGIMGTQIAKISMVNGGRIALYIGGSQVAISDNSYLPATWHFVEWHYKMASAPNGSVEVKVNGLIALTFSGNTKPGADTDFDCLSIGCLDFRSDISYYDDIAANNIAGDEDNSWCGDGHVELLVPSGNSPDGGWTDQWTGSDGNKDDNYALVDEVPPASTDYVEASVAGYQDRYALTDFTGTGKTILRTWVEARAIDTVPEGVQMKLGLRLAGADYLSTAIDLSSNYTRIAGTVYKQNPATGPADWTDSDLDAAQIVLEVV